jgi:biopolymer transport protein ExbB
MKKISALALCAALALGSPMVFAQAPASPAPAAPGAAAPAAPATDPNAVAPAAPMEAAPAAPAAPAEDMAAQPAPSASTETAVVDNPYGLGALWAQGDFVAKGTLIIMVIMSVFTWYILFVRLYDQQRVFSASAKARREFWASPDVSAGAERLEKTSPFRMIAEQGLRAAEHHDGKLTDHIDLNDWVARSLNRSVESVSSRLQGGLAFLATVGSTAPFIGLFGTVWGIYHALVAIGVSGQASIDKVAGPVGEALIMTAIGLAVAVPAVLGYNWLVRRNKVLSEQLRNFAADVHGVLLANAKARA